MNPVFSVLVPFHNAERTLRDCLDSLLRIEFTPERYRVVLVDNASTDSSASIAAEYPFSVVRESRKNPYSARNRGIRESCSDVVALTDADCVVDPDWLSHLDQAFGDPTTVACGGCIDSYPSTNMVERYADARGFHNNRLFLTTDTFFLPFIDTANAAFRRALFDDIGYFDDTHFDVAGDIDLSWRACLRGYRLHYVPEARVSHINRTNLKALLRQRHGYGYSHMQLKRKYSTYFTRRSGPTDNATPRRRPGLLASSFRRLRRNPAGTELLFLCIDLLCSMSFRCGYIGEMIVPSVNDHGNEPIHHDLPTGGLVSWEGQGGETHIVDLASSLRYRFNATAAFYWQQFRSHRRPAEVAEAAAKRWSTDAELIRPDIEAFYDQLVAENLLREPLQARGTE